jgi:hypothetical protein
VSCFDHTIGKFILPRSLGEKPIWRERQSTMPCQLTSVRRRNVPPTLLATADEVIEWVRQPQAGAIRPVKVRPK